MDFTLNVLQQFWMLLRESSVYIIFGLLISGLLRVFLNPDTVARHLGRGRFLSVFKAALLGVPIPLCSCGVLPAAVSLKRQGANNGAATAFMISTPESGVDSMAVTYALMDPLMTVVRPVAAFVTATVAGITENLFGGKDATQEITPDKVCPVDACCDGKDCPPEVHRRHHSLGEKIRAGFGFAFSDVWADMAGWFFTGLLLAGVIMALVPGDALGQWLGGGLPAMMGMLVVGIPIYICATASTPIAAALILKGVSPGAALVFLLVGPATNVTSLTVLFGVLGKRATAIYLISVAVFAVLFGLAVDAIYAHLGLSALAMAGRAGEFIPEWAGYAGAAVLVLFSVKPISQSLKKRFSKKNKPAPGLMDIPGSCSDTGCGCSHPEEGKKLLS